MMGYSVTLQRIHGQESPHARSVESRLLEILGKEIPDNKPVPFEYIIDELGFDDAMWCLRALNYEHDNDVRRLLCNLVEPALKYNTDPRLVEALQVIRSCLDDDSSDIEIRDKELTKASRIARFAKLDAKTDAQKYAAEAIIGAAAPLRYTFPWETAHYAADAAAYHLSNDRRSDAWREAWEAAQAEQEVIFRKWLEDEK